MQPHPVKNYILRELDYIVNNMFSDGWLHTHQHHLQGPEYLANNSSLQVPDYVVNSLPFETLVLIT